VDELRQLLVVEPVLEVIGLASGFPHEEPGAIEFACPCTRP
jgi:hypothetical protein